MVESDAYASLEEKLAGFEAWPVNHWEDLANLLESIKSHRCNPDLFREKGLSHEKFCAQTCRSVAVLAHRLCADSLGWELVKTAEALDTALTTAAHQPAKSGHPAAKPRPAIHWIAGHIDGKLPLFQHRTHHAFQLPGIDGFERWGDPYFKLFGSRLQRSHEAYKRLPGVIWAQALDHARRLGQYIKEHDIGLVLAVNVASLPGNLALTLSLVLISEITVLPVVCLNQEFFWQKDPSCPQCVRTAIDFFKNQHLAEVFSIVEQLIPWQSPLWLHANVSNGQSAYLIERLGVCPANVVTLPTVVDTERFRPQNKKNRAAIRKKLAAVFAKSEQTPKSRAADEFCPAQEPLREPVILGAKNDLLVPFAPQTLVLLQPTRPAPQRCVERDLPFLLHFLETPELLAGLADDSIDQIVLLISGAVLAGCERYFEEICKQVKAMFAALPAEIADRVFVAFAHGAARSTAVANEDATDTLTVSDLYGGADLVLLPSKTEGRGLPLMEAAASAVPMVTARFGPEAVYRQVTGSAEEFARRLRVLRFPGEDHSAAAAAQAGVQAVLDPEARKTIQEHNLNVARERFSMKVLIPAWKHIIDTLWLLQSYRYPAWQKARKQLDTYARAVHTKRLKRLGSFHNRQYVAGYWPLGYVRTLRGLMVPAAFLAEEQKLRVRLFAFARRICAQYTPPAKEAVAFYLATEALLIQPAGNNEILCDHSLAYRRRDFKKRLHDELTEQQLMGMIGKLATACFAQAQPIAFSARKQTQHRSREIWQLLQKDTDTWIKKMRLLANLPPLPLATDAQSDTDAQAAALIRKRMHRSLAIDDTSFFLQEVLHRPRDLVHFTGTRSTLFFELLFLGQQLLEHWRTVAARTHKSHSVTFVCRRTPLGEAATIDDLDAALQLPLFAPLNTLKESGVFQVLSVPLQSAGTVLGELSDEAVDTLCRVHATKGVVSACGDHNAHTLDLLDLPCFRFGTVTETPSAALLGIACKDAYVQLVPPAVRPTVGHPLQRQNGRSLSRHLHSTGFRTLARLEGGTDRLLNLIRNYCEQTGGPVSSLIAHRLGRDVLPPGVTLQDLCGRFGDGQPYTAVMCRLKPGVVGAPPKFIIQTAHRNAESVLDMVRRFQGETGEQVAAAWNGGYVLNDQVVRQLGLPAETIGTPLGLLMSDGEVLCPPLFNRPALTVDHKGRLNINRISLSFAGSIQTPSPTSPVVTWKKNQINPSVVSPAEVAVYTLCHKQSSIPVEDRVILVLSARRIHRIVSPQDCPAGKMEMLPIGLHISIPYDWFYDDLHRHFFEGTEVRFRFSWPPFWREIVDAVEAGPLLLRSGRVNIDLRLEGWKNRHSILSQAGRLDLENLRGPKIGVGITRQGDVLIAAVNGRLRDSVGATYHDLARLMREHGALSAMSFDPGGSATLVVGGKLRNTPPHNPNFVRDPEAAWPRPRRVQSAVLSILSTASSPNSRKH
jgi:glycosyltransferase involved in cell wall biosynthesis